jgi:dienelactone hydrolase
MTSKSWRGRSGLACVTISLLAGAAAAQTPAVVPALAVVDQEDAAQWQTWAKDAGWRVIAGAAGANPDARVQSLAAAVQEAVKAGVDPRRVYLVGRGAGTAGVFYTISRVPDLWAAALAIDGSPQPAIDTDRIYTANFANVPVLWASGGKDDEALAGKLNEAGLKLEWRTSNGLTNKAAFEWLAKHSREAFPAEIDCETNSPAFGHCYWIQMTKFDPRERNDVLPSTKLQGANGATLNLGGFAYKPEEAGPGVLVSVLGEKYSGPLRIGDRIVALDGRPIDNARAYQEMMARYTEDKPAVATIQRGKERIRVETRVVLPRRDAIVTARVEAQYLPAEREIQIVSRTVTEMRVTVPPQWAQDSRLLWNGLTLEKVEGPGCYVLTVEKELLHAAKCP